MTTAEQAVRMHLFMLQDTNYKTFQEALIPTVAPERVIGVRTPAIRAYAKELCDSAVARDFLDSLPHHYYDENNLHAALLDRIPDFDTALLEVERFLPYVDNWATCDMFCPKALRAHPDLLWERILLWLKSEKPYTIRYGLVRMITWYLDAPLFTPAVLDTAANVVQEDYYVRMAQAWLFSIALVKQYDLTLPYLTEHRLPTWIHNKAIQKALESYRVSPEKKTYLKTLKR